MVSIMKLNASSAGVRYYMAFDPVHSALYVSLPIEKRVVRIKLNRDGIVESIGTFVGNGKSCLHRPSQNSKSQPTSFCGDGGVATKSFLTYPKVGVIISPNSTLILQTNVDSHDSSVL